MPCPASFTPGKKPQCLLEWRLGVPQDWSGQIWRRENLFPPTGFEPWPIHSVASHITNYTILPTTVTITAVQIKYDIHPFSKRHTLIDCCVAEAV